MLSKRTINKLIATTGVILLGATLLTGLGKADITVASEAKTKNVIYLIADGMSDSVITATRYYLDANDDGVINNSAKLAIDDIRCGFVKTKWANGPITDSAPAGTALSSGYKTNPGYVGVDVNGVPYATVLEAAESNGLSTGMIATSEIMHATPAAFSSHNIARSNYNSIMKQQVYGDMEVVLGGGDKFLQADGGGKRKDGKDLTKELKALGYDYVTTKEGMEKSKSEKLWGMFAPADVAYDFDRGEFYPEQPSLQEMTQKAVGILEKNDKGFFLMIEGSKIDWAAHANNPSATIGDIIAFDEAVKYAVDYAKKNDNTIVVVTTDHANSGFSIGNSDTNSGYDNLTFGDSVMQLKGFRLSEDKFAELTKGKNDTEIAELITKYYGFTGITADEIVLAKEGKVNQVLAKRAKIGYTTGGHTGGDVYLGVWAPTGIAKLRGTVDNTDLARYVESNLGLDLDATSKKIFGDIESVVKEQNSTYVINTEDVENPLVEMKKDNVTIKLHVNTDILEVKAEGKEPEYKRIGNITVLSANKVYGATEEVNRIFKAALEENKEQTPIDPGKPSEPSKPVEPSKPSDQSNPNNQSDGKGGKLPNTGAAVSYASLITLALSLIGVGGYTLRNKQKK